MAENLAAKRCFNHPGREAIAFCSTCGRHFCRECVTEHMGRMTCSACLQKMGDKKELRKSALHIPLRTLQAATGLVLLWFILYYIGRLLILIPSSFHEGTFWSGG